MKKNYLLRLAVSAAAVLMVATTSPIVTAVAEDSVISDEIISSEVKEDGITSEEIEEDPSEDSASTDYTIGDYTYSLDTSNIVTIKKYSGYSADVIVPSEVEIDGKKYVINVIGSNAFEGNLTMNSVTIPKEINKLGTNAFKGCLNLTKIKADGKKYKITVTDKTVATMNKKGVVKCKSEGNTDITVTKAGDVTLVYHIKVVDPGKYTKSYKLAAGGSQALDFSIDKSLFRVEYVSSKENIATVDDNGVVKALAKGKTKIMIRVYGKDIEGNEVLAKTYTVAVKVKG